MSSEAKLAFGVEIELLLKPRANMMSILNEKCADWAKKLESAKAAEREAANKGDEEIQKAKQHAATIRKIFRVEIASILTNRFIIPAAASASNFLVWSVIDEVTLDEAEGYCQEDKWSTQHLNSIMKALSYFDDPITRIMPKERKNNPFAMSNLLSDECFKGNPKLRPLYQQVQSKTWKPLFDYFDAVMKSNLHKRQAHAIMGASRYASWNFEHITDACGTIEFRRCPAVDRSSQAKTWASFTLGFLYAAAFQPPDWSKSAATKAHPSITELDSFTKSGLRGLEATCQGGFQTLKEDTNPPHLFSAAEMDKILEKKKLLDSCADPDSYVQKVSL
ncbi:hypothetical protein SLS63_011597 [Diaporthe eres]|uniref:Uncharacterized protein n=1 Tax=Diaporthe eres TaxID=83184 RepID=A0ABR1NTJ4_DIAER